MQKRGFEENVSFVDDVTDGVTTTLHFEGDSFIAQKTFDATPHLEYAKRAREATAGQRFGEGKFIGHIPPAFYAKICVIKDRKEREKAVRDFFIENPAFRMYEPLKR
ncbi:MAG: hypothetical protein EOO23_01700 [Comamonadaceae bacterium]|nr:MAG: hypothetical protein EOO23_01700 [Comamonadaceae bacterium]